MGTIILNLGSSKIRTKNHLNGPKYGLITVSKNNVVLNAGSNGEVDAYSLIDKWNSENDYSMGIMVKNGKTVTINGGTYYGAYNAVYIDEGTVIINDGKFFGQHDASNNNKLLELNCKDANYKAGTAKFCVKGGKFYGFNPASNEAELTEGPTNFVCTGYASYLTDEKYKYVCKDETDTENFGKEIEYDVYKVVEIGKVPKDVDFIEGVVEDPSI